MTWPVRAAMRPGPTFTVGYHEAIQDASATARSQAKVSCAVAGRANGSLNLQGNRTIKVPRWSRGRMSVYRSPSSWIHPHDRSYCDANRLAGMRPISCRCDRNSHTIMMRLPCLNLQVLRNRRTATDRLPGPLWPWPSGLIVLSEGYSPPVP